MKRFKILFILFFVVTSGLLQSCGINSNVMFKVPKGEINYDSIPMYPSEGYRISIDDKLEFTLATNGGTDIISNSSGVSNTRINNNNEYSYVVRRTGDIEIPVLGFVHVQGLTIEQCEDTLTALFEPTFQSPFVQVKITNQRVIVFPGNGSDAKVIPLTNSNTTLMEAIAKAGGITSRGKANTIKLMRIEDGTRQVYGVDLSTIEGLKHADMIVQANDYIYIEPTAEIAREITKDLAPILSIFSSILFVFTAINAFK